ncbi:uncharacterized protein LOC8265131 [Ricinus communis]|uniref:F-box domain-containing protein n=1 Tax=Ricinus communis TaxID=3988 RepID=B9RKF8_RICCO|nr:uncharacterized protein LOC8265131 [Ricinus communis]EEF48156.1 conserved hypothetical protein [Ricinus communis]|eukprot:XP_002514202.1 uncharacterized protein LOC8265131 [Ricinus communis]
MELAKHVGPPSFKPKSIIEILGDDLVLRIFNFLTFQELSEIRNLSKHWRKLYNSVPKIRIDSRDIGEDRRGWLANLMHMHWESRPDTKRVEDFDVYWLFSADNDIYERERYHLRSWIREAARCNVRVINLDLHYRDDAFQTIFAFQIDDAYPCRKLENLSLSWVQLLLPTTGFYSLQVLQLIGVIVSVDNIGEWISDNCKRLKELKLVCVTGARLRLLNLTSSSLEKLQIYNFEEDHLCHISISCGKLHFLFLEFSSNSNDTSLQICAPNLYTLILGGDIFRNYTLEEFSNLQIASIYEGTNPFHRAERGAIMDRNLTEILRSVRQTRGLISDEKFLRPILEDNLTLPTFCNALVLCLRYAQNFPTLVSFLRVFPNLMSVEIISDELMDKQSAFPISETIKSGVRQVIRHSEKVEINVSGNIFYT